MPICLLSPPSPFITCRVSHSRPPPSPPPTPYLPPPPSSTPTPTPTPSLTCALQCPHFQSCSGCTQEFNLHRPLILEEVDRFFKGLGVSDFSFNSSRLWGWRCRAKLAVRGSSMDPLIGLYQEGTHNVVDIPDCKAHHPKINAAIELLRRGIRELNVEPYREDEGTGDFRYVQMAVTTHNTSLPASERYRNGKVQVALVWNSRNENSPNSEKLTALANFLWRNGGPRSSVHLIHSVWANFQTSSNNHFKTNELFILNGHKEQSGASIGMAEEEIALQLMGAEDLIKNSFFRYFRWRHLKGERDFWEHVGGIDMSLAPSSFGQANTQAFDALLHKLQKYVPRGASVVDLYAGAGVIGLSLAAARKCRSVKCIEINKESKLSFEKAVQRFPTTADSSISWHHADASVEPLSWLMGSDVVVVDPPRKGLDPSLIGAFRDLSSVERKAMSSSDSSYSKDKEEKRPWILRAREDSVQIGSTTVLENNQSLPQTLIYISCGWESFKEDCKALMASKEWNLEKAHGFNFFPGTQSIEVLAVFKRAQRVSLKKKKSGKKKKKRVRNQL